MIEKYMINTVKTAMQLLRLFTESSPEWGLTELAKEKSLNISNTKRLIDTLTQYGYLEKNPYSKKYRLGLTIVRLSGVLTTTMEIYKEARPFLLHLLEKYGESVHVGVLEGVTVVYLEKIEGVYSTNLTSTSHIGKRNPSYCTGCGKVLLAYKPAQLQQELLKKIEEDGFEEFGSKTVKSVDELKRSLKTIVQNGYAESVDELLDGITSVAVPIYDFSGNVIAAISLTGPSSKINVATCLDDLLKSNDMISANLGYIKSH